MAGPKLGDDDCMASLGDEHDSRVDNWQKVFCQMHHCAAQHSSQTLPSKSVTMGRRCMQLRLDICMEPLLEMDVIRHHVQ